MSHNHRKERISKLRGKAEELEAKLEGLTKSLMLKPGLYMAMSDREASAPNELSMQKFQSVRVIMAYSDGWGSCVNEDTGEKGIVPLSCLKCMDGFQVSEHQLSDHQLNDKKLLKKLSISDDILVKEPGIYFCVQDRIAERVNEISLEKGKKVRVLMVFSDGWGLCLDESTGEQGIAPLNILKLQGFNLDSLQEQKYQSTSKAIGYYRVLVDRIPIQPNEVLLLKGNIVLVSTMYSDGGCHW
jgi:hypothetical protein